MSVSSSPICPRCGNKLVTDTETRDWVCIYCGFIPDSQGRPGDYPTNSRITQKRLELLNRVAEQFGQDKVDAILKDDPALKQAWNLQLVRDVSKEFGPEKADVLLKDNPTLKQEYDVTINLPNEDFADPSKERGGPSGLWYLVPLFFGLIGGIIAYAAVKDKDESMATACLLLGFIIFFAQVFFLLAAFSHG